jgi:hypothetical protein
LVAVEIRERSPASGVAAARTVSAGRSGHRPAPSATVCPVRRRQRSTAQWIGHGNTSGFADGGNPPRREPGTTIAPGGPIFPAMPGPPYCLTCRKARPVQPGSPGTRPAPRRERQVRCLPELEDGGWDHRQVQPMGLATGAPRPRPRPGSPCNEDQAANRRRDIPRWQPDPFATP